MGNLIIFALVMLLFALLLICIAFVMKPTTTNNGNKNCNIYNPTYAVVTNDLLLKEFEEIVNQVSHERFELDNSPLVAECGYTDNSTVIYRFSCLKRRNKTIDEHELTTLRKQLNRLTLKEMQLKCRKLQRCQDAREYQNECMRNPYLSSCGFCVDNVCQTESAVIFEVYALDTPQNEARYKERGI